MDLDLYTDTHSLTDKGTSRTVLCDSELERRSGGGRVAHKFLQLQQPYESPRPEPTLQPKTTHLFSFAFVVPSEILPQACHHPCNSPEVHDSHLRLPPSFPALGPQGKHGPSHLDPSKVTISYAVRFRAMAIHPCTKQDLYRIDRRHDVFVSSQPVTSTSISKSMSPVLGPDISNEVILRDLGRRTGRLTATADEPKPIHLELDYRTTLLPIHFEFHPSSTDKLPPRPHKAHTKLEATTYFGTTPYTTLPDCNPPDSTHQQRAFRRHLALASRDITVHWEKSVETGLVYTASISLPVILPGAVTPSFYSCLIARVYALRVDVSFHSHLPVSSTISLSVPVHIIPGRIL